MKTIYCICKEVNDKGFYNSDKTFSNKIDAISYLRKLVAKDIVSVRNRGLKIKYLYDYKPNLSSDVYPKIIEYGYINEEGIFMHIDVRVNGITLFENQSEFSKYPVQF